MQHFRDLQRQKDSWDHASKNTVQYIERNERAREEFIAEIEALPEDSDLYYADESGFDECYSREYGYAPHGEKVIGKVFGKRFARTSMVAAKKGSEVVAPFAFSGSMDGDLFEGRLEHVFASELKRPHKSVLILDNASFHRKYNIYDIADDYGFRVIFLSAFSPDLNPIEKFWANVKKRFHLHMHEFHSFLDVFCRAFI